MIPSIAELGVAAKCSRHHEEQDVFEYFTTYNTLYLTFNLKPNPSGHSDVIELPSKTLRATLSSDVSVGAVSYGGQ